MVGVTGSIPVPPTNQNKQLPLLIGRSRIPVRQKYAQVRQKYGKRCPHDDVELDGTEPSGQSDEGPGAERVRSFAAVLDGKGDNVFVLQSASLRAEHLEEYLAWLLAAQTAQVPPATAIVLTTRFDESMVGGDLEDIQEIIVGRTVAPAETPSPQATHTDIVRIEEVGQGIDTSRTAGWATARRVLAELLGGSANVDSSMAAVPEDAELNVQVHIGYKTRKRKVDRLALKQLETGLRNLPDNQLQVRAKGASKSSDGSIRLHHPASIKLIKAVDADNVVIGSLLDPTDALRAMVEAYSTMFANGKYQRSRVKIIAHWLRFCSA